MCAFRVEGLRFKDLVGGAVCVGVGSNINRKADRMDHTTRGSKRE